jgi:hypothetical protein
MAIEGSQSVLEGRTPMGLKNKSKGMMQWKG